MRQTARFRLFLGLLVLAVVSTSLARLRPAQADNPPPGPEALHKGMHPGQVQKILGEPARISRQIIAHRTLEQWHYGAPHYLRLVFDCPRGEKPTLVQIYKVVPGAP
jgi:hypothetical protein